MRVLALALLLVAVSAFVLALAAQPADAFTFDLPAKKYRCFTEEVPSNVWMQLRYAIGSGYAQVVDIKVTDPKGVVVHEEVGVNKGQFESYSGVGGDFAVCFYSRMSSGVRATEGMKRTVRLEWRTGQDDVDYSALASSEHLKPMELHLRMMLDSVRSMHNMYEFFKLREVDMRNSNEYINSRVLICLVLVLVVLAGFAYWQVAHLKRFFRKKKLID